MYALCWRLQAIVKERGWELIAGGGDELERLCKAVIESHQRERDEYARGKSALMGFFIGQTMRASQNRADPKALAAVLARLLPPPAAPTSKK